MPTGRLKTWFAARGFGFIEDASGGPDIFVHVNALRVSGINPDELQKGDHLGASWTGTKSAHVLSNGSRQSRWPSSTFSIMRD